MPRRIHQKKHQNRHIKLNKLCYYSSAICIRLYRQHLFLFLNYYVFFLFVQHAKLPLKIKYLRNADTPHNSLKNIGFIELQSK